MINFQLEEVILAQGEVEKVSRDMWKSTLSIGQGVEREADRKGKEDTSISSQITIGLLHVYDIRSSVRKVNMTNTYDFVSNERLVIALY